MSHPNMRAEAADALTGLAGEPIEFYSDITNALHALEDVARPAADYVGVSLADAQEAALVTAVFDAWLALANEVAPGAGDATIRATPGWSAVERAARAARERMAANDRRFTGE
ncbi:MAG: hypothetical protein J7480_10600 [Microbacteriaceae bacterium]|nr:hypothetical protein [Microbacteriaceae bacterium]